MHFPIIVMLENPDDLEPVLDPFCEDVEQYMTEWESAPENEREYYDYDPYMQDWGYWYNANAEFDWWVLGGRFSGIIIDKDGKAVKDACDIETFAKLDFPIQAVVDPNGAWQENPDFRSMQPIEIFEIEKSNQFLKKIIAQWKGAKNYILAIVDCHI